VSRICSAALVLLISVPPVAFAQGEQHRDAGAHVHGHAEISLVVSGDELTVELHSPVFNILGFERAPASAAERAALAHAASSLKNALSIAVPSAGAQCRPISSNASLPASDDNQAPHEDTHGDDHDDAHPHPDLIATYAFKCARIDRLTDVTISAFRTFPGIRSADVVFIAPRTQTSRKLDASEPLFKVK
jgi:hypothetical protein